MAGGESAGGGFAELGWKPIEGIDHGLDNKKQLCLMLLQKQ